MGVGHVIRRRHVEQIGSIRLQHFAGSPKEPVVDLEGVDFGRGTEPFGQPRRWFFSRFGDHRPIVDKTLELILGGQQRRFLAFARGTTEDGFGQEEFRRFHVDFPTSFGIEEVIRRDAVYLRKARGHNGGVVDVGHRGHSCLPKDCETVPGNGIEVGRITLG